MTKKNQALMIRVENLNEDDIEEVRLTIQFGNKTTEFTQDSRDWTMWFEDQSEGA